MLITRKSLLTGRVHTREVPVTEEQLREWERGGLIQDVLPHLSANDREFLISGSTPEEWYETFAPKEE